MKIGVPSPVADSLTAPLSGWTVAVTRGRAEDGVHESTLTG